MNRKTKKISYVALLSVLVFCLCFTAAATDTVTEHIHSFADYVSDNNATCLADGTKTAVCTTCEATDTVADEGSMLEHVYGDYLVTKEATCTEEGEEKATCTLCGQHTFTKVIPQAGHKISYEVTPATGKADGLKTGTCEICNEYIEAVIPSIGSAKLDKTSFEYNKLTQKPIVTIKDSEGTVLTENVDYTLTYAEETLFPGKYKITVQFTGNYEGTETLSYSILPGKTSKVSTSVTKDSVTLKWNAVDGATGYRVYLYNSKTGKYKTLKTTTSTTYKATGLKSSTSYKFAIKAYTKNDNGTVWASESTKKTAKTAVNYYVKLSTSTVKVFVGDTKALKATVNPSGTTVKWKSSDTSIAKVSSSGKITALKKGTVTITAYFKKSGTTYEATCKVKVYNPSISLNCKSMTLIVGETTFFYSTTNPSGKNIKWSVSDKSLAKLSYFEDEAELKALKAGTVTVTASYTYKGKTYKTTCKITISSSTPKNYTDIPNLRNLGSYLGIKSFAKSVNNTENDVTVVSYFYQSSKVNFDKLEKYFNNIIKEGKYLYAGYNETSSDITYVFYNLEDSVTLYIITSNTRVSIIAAY